MEVQAGKRPAEVTLTAASETDGSQSVLDVSGRTGCALNVNCVRSILVNYILVFNVQVIYILTEGCFIYHFSNICFCYKDNLWNIEFLLPVICNENGR